MKKPIDADGLLNMAIDNCKKDLDKFRGEHVQLIRELIGQGAWENITEIFFKQGFSSGLSHSREMRDLLNKELK